MQTAFPRYKANKLQTVYNANMNAARVFAEWSCELVKQSFSTPNFNTKLQVRKAPIDIRYMCCVLLRNFKNCLEHGSLVSSYYNGAPPSLVSYCMFNRD